MNLLSSIAIVFSLMQRLLPFNRSRRHSTEFTAVGKRPLVIEVESGQNMRMFVTGSTKFIRDGKPSKASEFHDGDP